MDEIKRQLNELIAQVERNDGVTWEEAHRRVSRGIGAHMPEIMKEIQEDREAALWEQLHASSDAQITDRKHAPWYLGPLDEPSSVWGQLKARMESGGLASATPSIDKHSTEIVEQLARPHARHDKRRGLVIGYVQSGKTANYAAVVAKALDAGYRLVIVLAGVLNNLRQQTQGRLIRDLGVKRPEWTELTSMDGDFAAVSNPVPLVNGSERLLAVAKKNPTRLENIRRFLQELPKDTRENLPILIIDDEADQVTPDSEQKREEMSKIHAQLRQIWSLVENGTYVSYTATPFANLFMEPDDEGSLYPRDFIHALPEPEGYFGARRIFGLDEADPDADAPDTGADVVRNIPDDDLEDVVPPRGRSADIADFEANVPPSLADAIRWFIIATTIRRKRGQGDKHSSMLVHTTSRVDPHFAIQDALDRYLFELKRVVKEHEDWSGFRALYVREIERAAELRDRSTGEDSFEELKPLIRAVLSDVVTIVDNGSEEADKRLSYPDDRAVTAIVIGGGTLSRGLTLEGLFVSYFTRTARTYDTLLQMGRWFGFRTGYADLQRIWLSSGLAGDYQYLATIEAEVRREIAQMRKAGQTPAEVGIRVRNHPGRLEITGRAKMKHAERLRVGFEGRRDQTHVFDVRENVLKENLEVGRRLLTRSRQASEPIQPVDASAVLHRRVPYGAVREFLRDFQVHPFHGLLHDGTVLNWLDEWDDRVQGGKVPGLDTENLWNVVLASGATNSSTWTHGGITIRKTRRAAVKREFAPTEAQGEDARSIRALMSAGDHLADVRLLARSGAPGFKGMAQEDIRDDETRGLRKKLLSGRGLLVLYVIDKESRPSPAQEATREPLNAREDVLGFGLIAPVNPNAAVFDQDVFIGVTPTPAPAPEDEEEDERFIPEDTEADHEVDN